jgi:tRNA (guanine-N7-)-methyltransferase
VPLLHSDVFEDVASRVNAEINPYVAELLAGVNDQTLPLLHGPTLRNLKGRWRELFTANSGENRPLVLEIGCHLGKTIRDMAASHPETDFVGMDITFKRVVTTARRAVDGDLKNIKVILASAKQLDLLAGCDELDGVIIFFPDPWNKRRKQLKNRLIDEEFCQGLRNILRPEGYFWFKTDQIGYFVAAKNHLETVGFQQVPNPTGLPGEIFESTFERKFKAEGLPSYEGVWVNSRTQ